MNGSHERTKYALKTLGCVLHPGKRFLPVECPKTFPLGTVGAEIICANQRNRSKCILSKRGQFCQGEYKESLDAEMYFCFDLPALTIFCPIPGPRLFRLILDNSRKLADHEVTTRTIKNLPFECRSTLTSESWMLSTLTCPRGQLCIMLSQMTKLYLEIGAFRQCCRWLCFPCVPVGTTTIQMFLPHEEGAQMRTGCTGVTTWFGGLGCPQPSWGFDIPPCIKESLTNEREFCCFLKYRWLKCKQNNTGIFYSLTSRDFPQPTHSYSINVNVKYILCRIPSWK